ncbi:hypothetical protein LX32DRAFT_421153 [Colletotrichum zoysiae]|uniref:Secreted protein n=1 Tax=Colletotrichum zoysiae TaxID=1216348 RepID=A0AAD9M8Z3_9PEZI|nr:hypothetical protein LX32DRAFT_421153 [Colletotrichum zoysiae]
MLLLLLLLLPNLLPTSPLLSYRLSTRLLDFALALASTESLLIPTSSQLRPLLVCLGTGSKQALTGRANLVCPWSNRRFREVHPDPCTSCKTSSAVLLLSSNRLHPFANSCICFLGSNSN